MVGAKFSSASQRQDEEIVENGPFTCYCTLTALKAHLTDRAETPTPGAPTKNLRFFGLEIHRATVPGAKLGAIWCFSNSGCYGQEQAVLKIESHV